MPRFDFEAFEKLSSQTVFSLSDLHPSASSAALAPVRLHLWRWARKLLQRVRLSQLQRRLEPSVWWSVCVRARAVVWAA